MEKSPNDRRDVPILQKLSEWSSILALATVIFWGGALYQKIDAISEQLKTQNAQMTSLGVKLALIEVEVERQKGEDNLQRYMIESLMQRITPSLPPK